VQMKGPWDKTRGKNEREGQLTADHGRPDSSCLQLISDLSTFVWRWSRRRTEGLLRKSPRNWSWHGPIPGLARLVASSGASV